MTDAIKVVGFTGTRRGMTEAQRRVVRTMLTRMFQSDNFTRLDHGDCVGADEEVHAIARALGYSIVIHPPTSTRFRAWCLDDHSRYEVQLPYLTRNRAIVAASHFVIATPGEALEQQHGGTWYTYRYAGQVGRPRMLVLPDGSVRVAGKVPVPTDSYAGRPR